MSFFQKSVLNNNMAINHCNLLGLFTLARSEIVPTYFTHEVIIILISIKIINKFTLIQAT